MEKDKNICIRSWENLDFEIGPFNLNDLAIVEKGDLNKYLIYLEEGLLGSTSCPPGISIICANCFLFFFVNSSLYNCC